MAREEDEVAYTSILAELTAELNKRKNLEKEINDTIERSDMSAFYKAQGKLIDMGIAADKTAIQFNSISTRAQKTVQTLTAINQSSPAGKMLYLGQALSSTGRSLTDLRDKIYALQNQLGTTFATAVDSGTAAFTNQITSLFTAGPALSFKDSIDAINAFQKEFGTLLSRGAAADIAKGAKQFGTDINTFVRAQRAFLVGPTGLGNQAKLQQQFITQFRAAGLTANQALTFAANNANLVAIAGVKYADALARAAANATKIGVSLDKTEQFADTLVGDFEGGLERISELRAMGVEVDFNELARVAGTGTPEEVFDELSRQLGGNNALLEEVQRNRFLKVAIERDLGLNIADVQRLAAGPGGLPGEETKPEETENGTLATIMKVVGPFAKVGGILATAIGVQTMATMANTAALLGSAGTGMLQQLGLRNAAGGMTGLAKGGMVGAGLGIGIGGAMAGRSLVEQGKTKTGIGLGALSGGLGLALALAPFTGGASLVPLVAAGLIGAVAGGGYAAMGMNKANDIAMGPGGGRVLLGPEGAFSLNAKDSILAGTNLMGSVGEGAFNAREGYATSVSGAGALAGGLGGQLTGAASGRMVGGAMGSVLRPVGTIDGGFLGANASAVMAPKEPASGTLTTPQTAIAQQPATTTVNMNTSGIESKLDRLASVFGAMKIEMDGNTVGRVSLNARSPLDRLSVAG
jgi:hypothetical protein